MIDTFYLTLPSNTAGNDGKNNQSSFRVELPRTLDLIGEWEVGLCEYSYPYSFYNVGVHKEIGFDGHPKETKIDFDLIGKSKYQTAIESFHISPGQYDTIDELIQNINVNFNKVASMLKQKEIEKEKKWVEANPTHDLNKTKWFNDEARQKIKKLEGTFKLVYVPLMRRVKVQMDHSIIGQVQFSEQINYILGDFMKKNAQTRNEAQHPFVRNNSITGYPPDLRAGITSMFLYTDIITPNIIGNTMARLLRTIPVRGHFGDVNTEIFDQPHYLPLAFNTINSIEINIKDHLNRFIKFSHGIVLVKLHFRKKKFMPF